MKIKSKLLYYYYKLLFMFKKKNVLKDDNDIVISMTSIPSRFKYLYLDLETLFHQTLKPSKIVLYLGTNVEPNMIPKRILAMKKRGLEIKFRDDKLLKPHTKYFYALNEYKDKLVITCDDDIFYNKNLVKILYNSYLKYPNAISCIRPHKITFDKNGNINNYKLWLGEYNEDDSLVPNNYLCATGVGGVLYPKALLPKETFDINLISTLAINQDDLWLKFIEVKYNIKVVRATKDNIKPHVINGTQEVSLSEDNVFNNRNDSVLKDLNDHFKFTKKDFDK